MGLARPIAFSFFAQWSFKVKHAYQKIGISLAGWLWNSPIAACKVWRFCFEAPKLRTHNKRTGVKA